MLFNMFLLFIFAMIARADFDKQRHPTIGNIGSKYDIRDEAQTFDSGALLKRLDVSKQHLESREDSCGSGVGDCPAGFCCSKEG